MKNGSLQAPKRHPIAFKFGLRLASEVRQRVDKVRLHLTKRAGGVLISTHATIIAALERGLTEIENDARNK